MFCILSNKGMIAGSYVNSITKEMDTYIKRKDKNAETYLCEDRTENYIYIRYPGATRGRIVVDENDIIRDIVLYENTNIYEKEIHFIFEKYIGMKIFLAEDKYKEVIKNNINNDLILYLYSNLNEDFLKTLKKNYGFVKKEKTTYIPIKNIQFKKKESLLNGALRGKLYDKCYLDEIILDKNTLNLLNLATIKEGAK